MNKSETLTVTAPTDHEIVMTRMFDAPRAVVFATWTQTEHVVHWWDPTGVPLQVCEIDLRINGTFRWVNRGVDGQSFTGTYREIVEPERIVFTSPLIPSSPDLVTTLIFSVDGLDRTKLVMTILCASVEDRNAVLEMRIDVGTARTLDNLAAYIREIR